MRQPYARENMAGASDAFGAVAAYRFDDGRVVLYAFAPSSLGAFANRFRLRALFNRARAKLES